MELNLYLELKSQIINLGYQSEIDQIQSLLDSPCDNDTKFFREYTWVVLNSGLRNQVAELLYYKILYAIKKGYDLNLIFRHPSKVDAIKFVLNNKTKLFYEFQYADDKIEYLTSLPFIGPATKYHLARNLGLDVCKPDRHLLRISKKYNTTPESLCKKISNQTKEKIGLVDVILWRAANLKLI